MFIHRNWCVPYFWQIEESLTFAEAELHRITANMDDILDKQPAVPTTPGMAGEQIVNDPLYRALNQWQRVCCLVGAR